MTFTGFLMAAVIIFIALYFGYRAVYGEPRIDRDDVTHDRKWKLRKARAQGKDHLYSVVKHKPEGADSVRKREETAAPRPIPPKAALFTVRNAPLLTETGKIGDVDGPDVSNTATRSQWLSRSTVQALQKTGHGGSYQYERVPASIGDDTGGIAEAQQGELPGLGSLITGVDVSSANNAGDEAIAPADSYVESNGEMKHDEPYLGDLNKRK